MASLKDISIACGVSVSAVSKALNNHKDIGEETRELIKKTAKEMGYLPNYLARALKTNRTHNLGVLFIDEARSGLTHDYFSAVLESFKVTAEAAGYDITFTSGSNQRKDKMTYLEHSRYRGFDGVVIACSNFDDQEVKELVESSLPVVTIDHIFPERISINSDNEKGIEDLVNYIYECGHRKIAYIHGPLGSSVSEKRLLAFNKTTKRLGLDIPKDYIVEADYRDTKGTEEVTKALLDMEKPPTCILYPDDFASLGGINAIKSRNLEIPKDISIAGYDGIKVASYIEPKITTIRQDTEKLGRYAAKKLIDLIERPESAAIKSIIVKGKLIKGGTVKKITK